MYYSQSVFIVQAIPGLVLCLVQSHFFIMWVFVVGTVVYRIYDWLYLVITRLWCTSVIAFILVIIIRCSFGDSTQKNESNNSQQGKKGRLLVRGPP